MAELSKDEITTEEIRNSLHIPPGLADRIIDTIAARDKTIAEYDAMIDGMADANLSMRKRIGELETDQMTWLEREEKLDASRAAKDKRIEELERKVTKHTDTTAIGRYLGEVE